MSGFSRSSIGSSSERWCVERSVADCTRWRARSTRASSPACGGGSLPGVCLPEPSPGTLRRAKSPESHGGAERDRTRAAERHETPARRSRDEQPPTEGFPPSGTGRLWSGPYAARMPRVRPLPPPVPPPRGRLARSKRFPSARSSSYPCRQSPASDAWSREGSIERPLRTSSLIQSSCCSWYPPSVPWRRLGQVR
jgi:hypothetical protein